MAGIDPEFQTHLQITGKHLDHAIFGVQDPPNKLGIHGTYVAVDFDLCVADGACLDACPVNVFDWFETLGHAISAKKADPAREEECIFCMACESVCPPMAIKISPK